MVIALELAMGALMLLILVALCVDTRPDGDEK